MAWDSLALAPSYVVPGIASLVAIPLLFGALGAEGYGTWALVFAIANGVPVVTSSWLEAISVRFGHRPRRQTGVGSYAASILASALGAAVLAVWLIPGADLPAAASAVAYTVAVVVYLLVQARLQAALAFAWMSRSATVRAVTAAVLAVAGAWLTGSPAVAALGSGVGFLVGAAIAWPVVAGATRGVEPALAAAPETRGPAADDLRREGTSLSGAARGEIGFGLASAVAALAAYVLSVGDRFVLSSLRPLAEVGTYTATYAVVDLVIRLAPSVVFAALRPRLFRAWDRGDRATAAEGVTALAAMLAWGTAAIVAVGVAVTELAPATRLDPRLVGPIGVGLAAFVVGNAVALLYASSERQARLAAHVVLGAALNIALNLALGRELGAVGAAIATALSYLFVLVLNVHGLRASLTSRWVRDGGLAVLLLTCVGCAALLGPAAGATAGALVAVAAVVRAGIAARAGLRLRRSAAR